MTRRVGRTAKAAPPVEWDLRSKLLLVAGKPQEIMKSARATPFSFRLRLGFCPMQGIINECRKTPMPPPSLPSWIIKSALLAALFVFAGPSKAMAGCGGEVHWGSPHVQKAEQKSPAPLDRPCSGPTCQKAPAAPSTFPPVLFQAHAPRLDAILIDAIHEEEVSARLRFDRARPVLNQGAPLLIFHPPR